VNVDLGTVEKPTLENMGIALGFLSVGGTEPENYSQFAPPDTTQLDGRVASLRAV